MKPVKTKAEGKKKPKEEPVPEECAKKGKVHAQRKFAEGAGPSSSASSGPLPRADRVTNKVINTSLIFPESSRVKPMPTTAQFIDFLCFSRSSLLAPSLHYLRGATLAPAASPPPPPNPPVPGPSREDRPNGPLPEKVTPKDPDALRKKYHDQRIAKQKASNVTKLAQKVKGKVMVRTRSRATRNNAPSRPSALPVSKIPVLAVRKSLHRVGKLAASKLVKGKHQRAGLRSHAKLTDTKNTAKEDTPRKADAAKTDNTKTKTPEAGTKKKKPKRGGAGDESSDDEPLSARVQQPPETKKTKILTRTRSKVALAVDDVSKKNTKGARPIRLATTPVKKSAGQQSPEKRVGAQEDGTGVVSRSIADKTKKKENQVDRRTTRSTPILQKKIIPKKQAAIRELIQKKKQMSLKTLKRLKEKPKKPVPLKPNRTNSDVKEKGSPEKISLPKKELAKKKDKTDVTPRTLRKKAVDSADLKKNEFEVANPDKMKTKTASEKNKRASKRPVRKCSTVDKMWIDVDGFTSDEDGFIDTESIVLAPTTSASKRNNNKDTNQSVKNPCGKNNSETASKDNADKSEEKIIDVLSISPPEKRRIVSKEGNLSKSTVKIMKEEMKVETVSSFKSETDKNLKIDIPKKSEDPMNPDEKADLKKVKVAKKGKVDPVFFPRTAAWIKLHEQKNNAGTDALQSNSSDKIDDSHTTVLTDNNAIAKKSNKVPVKDLPLETAPKSAKNDTIISMTEPITPKSVKGNPAASQVEPEKQFRPEKTVTPLIKSASTSSPPASRENKSISDSLFPRTAAWIKSHTQKAEEVGNAATQKNVRAVRKKSSDEKLGNVLDKTSTKKQSKPKFQQSTLKASEKRGIVTESEEESDVSSEKVLRKKKKPSPRAEVVTRKERPKRQCSSMGKSWIEQDSDDSTYYENDQDLMEMIRRSEKMNIERRKSIVDEEGSLDSHRSDPFSDSDDEPLKKKPILTPSTLSLLRDDSPPPKPVPREGLSMSAVLPTSVPAPAVVFRSVPREPINTHGLDLLSEVADKSTDRIEQWLKQSIRSDDPDVRKQPPPVLNDNIPDPVLQFVRTPSKPALPESPVKKIIPKAEPVPKRPPVSSVTDLIKLQKERKGSPKPIQEHQSKNCKCNSCVVMKGWFKNKPSPEEPKPITKESVEKPPETPPVTKASVSVAPMVQEVQTSLESNLSSPRKRGFFERMRERGMKEALVKPELSPFSPSNESSVYAFEPEPSKPVLPKTQDVATGSNHAVSSSRSQSHQSASIAVQVNMDTGTNTTETVVQDDGRSFEISTQTEGADDAPMFYFPLAGGTNVASQQPMIQSVTVKLGTEGTVGVNQTLVMQAKLVTEPHSPPTKRKAIVMPQKKQTNMTPPVGTVQPTTRRPVSSSPRPRASVSPSSSQSSKSGAKNSSTLRGTASSTKSSPANKNSTVTQPSLVMEAPTYHLSEKDFTDPLEFFDRIRQAAERFGICRIVPPSSFKPDCKVADDMRFVAYNQYVHRLFHRWGPSAREMMAMKKYLKSHRISLKPPPLVGGVEVDLPRLYQAVQRCGGLMKVMEKDKWQQVADLLRLPKAANDRVTKLDSIYCQYLLPYETLKEDERKKLLDEVDAEWAAHEAKINVDSEGDDEEEDNDVEECVECIVKGRSMALNQFYRIARNTMSMWFSSAEPDPREVETEFWRLVTERKQHVCVHSGSIDSSGWGYGFPVGKNTFAKHPWNLKVLTNNSGSVLRSLGPVMGVTVPTLHVGMVFAAFCWYRDPHGLPWVEYLHTGAPKIWYGISDNNSSLFRETLSKLMPKYIKEQRIWLPSDTAMVPPERLAELGVPLSRTTQNPGEFVVVFPRAFTSSLCTGYLVSESVYFARPTWLATAEEAFRDIHDSAEPTVFSLDNLLLSIAADSRASLELLKMVLPKVQNLKEREESGRAALRALGLSEEPLLKDSNRRRGRRPTEPEPDHECYVCRMTLFLSMVSVSAEDTVFCLQHGCDHLNKHPDQVPGAKLLIAQEQASINEIFEKLQERISSKESKAKQ